MINELRAARQRRGIAQADLARQIGTTQSAVARLETAQLDPRLGTVQRYAASVGMQLIAVPLVTQTGLVLVGENVRSSLEQNDPDEAFHHVIQFLDDIERVEPHLRQSAVRDEPAPVGDSRWDALLAGIAEYASQRFSFPVPGWAAAPGRFLRYYWFVIEDLLGRPAPGLAALAFAKSPAALAGRGVFLDSDSLVSV